jgi:lipid-A-disaccharide synthase
VIIADDKTTMRIFINTGEVSGDLQGALLVEALLKQAAERGIDLEITALGGDRMAAAGARLLGNTAAIGAIGIFESIPFIIPSWIMQRRVKQYIRQNPPDILVLIDYLGPNLGLGTYIRKNFPEIPIIYYIAPQTWVWSPGNKSIEQMIKLMDRLLAIFPAEATFFAERGASVQWVGHPLLDRMATAPSRETARQALGIPAEQMAVALFPASRYQELKYLLPVICAAAQLLQQKLPQVHFYLPVSLLEYRSRIEEIVAPYGLQLTLIEGRSLEVMAAADLAIAKSGTVNLEISLLGIPQVVICLVNPATMWVARKLLKFSIPFMSPSNLVVMKEIVPELLQEEATPERIVHESLELLLNPDRRQQTIADCQEMRSLLGEVGVCDRAATEILNHVLTAK